MLVDAIYYTLYGLSIGGIFLVAALVYSKRKEAEYRFFSIFTILLGAWLALQLFAQIFNNIATLFLVLDVAVSPFFAIYFYFFARQYVGSNVKQGVHFIFPTIAAAFSLFTPLVISGSSASLDGIVLTTGPLYYPIFGIVALYAIGALICIFQENMTKDARSMSRRQANTLLIIAAAQAIVIVAIASVFFADVPIGQALIPFALFLMVLIFGYAIVKQRLFDIRLAAVRALGYSFSLVTIGGIYYIIAFTLINTFLSSLSTYTQHVLFLLIALLTATIFTPLKRFFDRQTGRLFYRDAYQTQKVIDEFSAALVSTVDIDKLSQHAMEILRIAIKSQYITILLVPSDKRKKSMRLLTNGKDGSLKEKELYTSLMKRREHLVSQDEMYRLDEGVFKTMLTSNCAVAARLETHSEFIGYVLFGLKDNGRPYTNQDEELIRITADELALAIQNALHFEEIRLFNHTLQAKIEDATSQLVKTNKELRHVDETKDEFISMASHQLRTPLTSVKGYLSMVLEGDTGKITNMQRQLLGEAFTSSERMVHLIGDFLNVSRLQTGKFILEQRMTDLGTVTEQEVNSLQTTATARELTLEYRKPSYFPMLYIDDNKIRQVIMNFIDNAIYYSTPETTIRVELSIVDGDALLQVHDTGIGVPKAEQAHLFTKFFRATNARKQRPDGTGIGLFLAKKIIVAHGGSMVFESVEGQGSTFGFRLPISQLSNAPADDADKLNK